MLRGINVSGHKTIKMQDLRTLCNKLGYRNVQTYVQSGNIVFETRKGTPANLSKQISKAIHDAYGFDVPAFIRTLEEMQRIISANPFLKEKNIDQSKLHVTFLSETPQADSLRELGKVPAGQDRFHIVHNVIYLHCPTEIAGPSPPIPLSKRPCREQPRTETGGQAISLPKIE